MSEKDKLEAKLTRLEELLDNARDAETDYERDDFRCARLQGLADQALVGLLREILQQSR